ncbi:sulfide/dihydroorotate dehydrogenase-like FAD/NAD-binding protein [Candidatus Aminicenantes bacterium AC-335-K20]|jgi:ferredoxin--NADP+ reductase|nr:sulfide/dihydroorotate dehydrogenase-like FAD/NAD-binding protein [SCandidatus Aminicenantes bacterium Aminicenantia_JdfR_composite]MCP2605875.1 sulfide/dihydroorotate dehydrogenase-like FAD/NAD-binding protein [Candidatus Aminicenantes bacterium AC-335-O07]MCP2619168.1 sulfide/dihydroorotate dehydrogenase-like FAD/NAD-binding protein [Candidatus Aminicenantes bacterium AC-335-K20]MCP2620651.1 sulfide/dihydroorotate dehydrogenase-like FAD/NAD-binding protein [Candidatus Aminicenantes bacteriu
MFKIIKRENLVPNIHLIKIHAPKIAEKCKPGQFVIIMPDEKGERIPLSIADWDKEEGTITSVFLVVGTSTFKLSRLNAGDSIPSFVGPLGRASEIDNFGTVVCVGGCYGIGAIYPIVKALKEKGNEVITLIDVRSKYLLYWEEKLKKASDEFIVSSRDGSYGFNGYAPEALKDLIQKEKIDRVIVVGCTYLMYKCSETTKPYKIKTTVSLNPIMVDGTGMCGACRVKIGEETKFACVDGPEFDGHSVDWEELFARRKFYFDDEILSLCEWEKRLI